MAASTSESSQEQLPLHHASPSYGTSVSVSAPGYPAKRKARVLDTVFIVIVPWVFFTLTVCLFAFALEDYKPLVWVMALACVLLSMIFIAVGVLIGSVNQLAVGLLTLVSVIIAVLVGLLLQREYMHSYWTLDSGAMYIHVDPAEPAASRADATQLYFKKGSTIDTQHSLGYMRSYDAYCVAPIIGHQASSTVEYWAAGKNCCDSRGGFTCDDAGEQNEAYSAVVVTSDLEFYRTAARMAGSVYQLGMPKANSTGTPIFVQRSGDISVHLRFLWWRTVSMMLVASGIHLAVSCGAAFVLQRVRK